MCEERSLNFRVGFRVVWVSRHPLESSLCNGEDSRAGVDGLSEDSGELELDEGRGEASLDRKRGRDRERRERTEMLATRLLNDEDGSSRERKARAYLRKNELHSDVDGELTIGVGWERRGEEREAREDALVSSKNQRMEVGLKEETGSP